jgi:HK97 family phage major capsid protein
MKSSKQLREEIGQREDRIDAILDVAKADNRDLTDPERAEIDRIQGRGEAGDPDHIKGEILSLREDLRRVEAIEARQLERARDRAVGAGTLMRPSRGELVDNAENDTRASRVIIPQASRFRYSKLKSFKGEHAEQKAYMAGQFFLATLFNVDTSKQWCHDHGISTVRNALKESANELGGVLVPEELEQTIIDLRADRGVFRREARDVPMQSDTKVIPRRTGGVTAYYVDESPASGITESENAWDHVRLTAKKLAVLTRYSSEIAEDAIIAIGDHLAGEIAYAFASAEDEAGFNGDGTSTYGGIVGLKNARQYGLRHARPDRLRVDGWQVATLRGGQR